MNCEKGIKGFFYSRKSIFLITGFSIFLFLFLSVESFAKLSLDDQLYEIVKENRESILLSEEEIISYLEALMYESKSSRIDSNDIIFDDSGSTLSYISKLKARSDVNFLFEVLGKAYAGYQLYGGDESFDKARENILTEIDDFPSFLGIFEIDSFREIISRNLSFINDGHFIFEGESFENPYRLYLAEDYYFKAVADDFLLIGEEELYFSSLAGKDAINALWPSLDSQANLIYRVGLFLPEGESELLKPLYLQRGENNISSDDNYYKKEEVLLKPLPEYLPSARDDIYLRMDKEGIPILQISSFQPLEEYFLSLESFVKDAEELATEDAIIIDMRFNNGGSEHYLIDCLVGFTGKEISSNSFSMVRKTAEAREIFLNHLEYMIDEEELILMIEDYFQSTESPWGEIRIAPFERVENNTLIIVLMDSVSSAGEAFIRHLRQFDNTIFIGANSNGLKTVVNQGAFTLPYSGFNIKAGVTLRFDTDLVFREGIGYFPDFWVDPNQALEIAVELIRKHQK